mmetsp:Transcript_77128/g.200601  ORF Transcript_77128/g.200601 Transcript_77128/m.200601 type:complete len:651 (-) Transcript_77128:143-2095(-)
MASEGGVSLPGQEGLPRGGSEERTLALLPNDRSTATAALFASPQDAREVQTSSPAPPAQRSSKIFPLEIPCCPCFPKVQGWLHLILITGVLGSLICLLQMIVELGWEGCDHSWLCYKQIVSGIFVLPSTLYFMKFIGNYDEDLEVQEEKQRTLEEELRQALNDERAKMERFTAKFAGMSAEFADQGFGAHKKTFMKFLNNVTRFTKDLYADSSMLEELRTHIIHWFDVFSGVILSERREEHDLLRDLEAELNQKSSVEEVCKLAVQRLDSFTITIGMDTEEARLLSQDPGPRVSDRAPGPPSASFVSNHSVATTVDLESQHSASRRRCGGNCCGLTWLKGGCTGCKMTRSNSNLNGWPFVLECGLFTITLLSRPHVNLLLSFFMDIGLILFEAFSDRWPSFVLVILNVFCVSSLLLYYEQIDKIKRTERRIGVLEGQKNAVEARATKAEREWKEVQQLQGMWLHRSLPSLTILNEFQTYLADLDREEDLAIRDGKKPQRAEERLEFIRTANARFSILQQKLGDLEEWRKDDGSYSEERKKGIGKLLKGCANKKMQDILEVLPILTSSAVSQLEDVQITVQGVPAASSQDVSQARPAGSPRLSPRPSPHPSPPGSPRAGASFTSNASTSSRSTLQPPQPTGGGWFGRGRGD